MINLGDMINDNLFSREQTSYEVKVDIHYNIMNININCGLKIVLNSNPIVLHEKNR